jgi:hypothetical protein
VAETDQKPIPKAPTGLKAAGRRVWDQLNAECEFLTFDMLMLVEEAARTRDLVVRLQKVVDTTKTLRTSGSKGQDVAIPELTELRQYRAQFAALIRQLDLPAPPEPEDDEDDDGRPSRPMSRSEAGAVAAAARWDQYRAGPK